jgi:ribokinase
VRCAVVGHVEWTEFASVDHVPAPGQIAHGTELWSGPAGAGPVVASQLHRLAGACAFFTVLGDDDLGAACLHRLRDLGLEPQVEWFASTRRALTLVDDRGERTIVTVGPKLRPRGPLDLAGYDLVFFVAGEPRVLRSARAARFLAATLREQPTLREGNVRLDLLVGSSTDPGERYEGGLDAALVVRTEGARGGTADGRRFAAAPPPGPVVDTYGAGDSFQAALAFALARGDDLDAALDLAARAGAAVIAGRGPYAAQLARDG